MITQGVTGAAKILRIDEATMYELLERGDIPAAKIGREWVITEEDLSAFLREQIDKQTAARISAVRDGIRPVVKTALATSRAMSPGRARIIPPDLPATI